MADRGSKAILRINVNTGKVRRGERLAKRRVIRWLADRQLRVRAAMIRGRSGQRALLVKSSDGSDWQPVMSWPKGEQVRLYRFSSDGRRLLIADNKAGDTLKLYWFDPQSRERVDIFEDPQAEIVEILLLNDQVAAVATEREKRVWKVLDPKIQSDFEIIREKLGENFSLLSRSANDRRWVLAGSTDVRPDRTFLLDRESGQLSLIHERWPGMGKYDLVPSRPVVIPTRDGLEMICYLTLPKAAELANARAKPLLVLAHGGPEKRAHWRFNPTNQLLASRGYAILSVNFRGSTGLGKAFFLAGRDNRVGGKTPQDLADAVAWAISHADIDPKRVAVMGASYGGYAALASLALNPELYACGVDLMGPSNLIRQNRFYVPARVSLEHARKAVFDPRWQKARAGSPAFVPEKIQSPLLVAHGAADATVRLEQSDDFVDDLRDAGGCAEFVVYADEAHGFKRSANYVDFMGRLETFLATHLCGQAEPFVPSTESSAERR